VVQRPREPYPPRVVLSNKASPVDMGLAGEGLTPEPWSGRVAMEEHGMKDLQISKRIDTNQKRNQNVFFTRKGDVRKKERRGVGLLGVDRGVVRNYRGV